MFKFEENKDLAPLTTFGIPAKARYYAEYASEQELLHLSLTPVYNENELLHIGGGSNLLFLNDFNGLIIRSAIKGLKLYRKDADTVFVIAGAGENWDDLVAFCVDNDCSGLENLSHIPGQVGASAIQNVGAYGVEAKDYIHTVECFDRRDRKVVSFRGEECGFGYRDSIFKHEARGRYFVLRISFKLVPGRHARHLDYGPLRSLEERLGHTPDISEVREEIIRKRSSKLPDPKVIGSAGSFFKNPVVSREYYEKVVLTADPETPCYDLPDGMVKIPAGWLIERCGLKGKRIGDAEVYPKQCLVIANAGGATAQDVLKLSDAIRTTVNTKFHVMLNPEVNFIDTSIQVTVLGSGTSKGVPEIGCTCPVCTSTDPHDKRLRASILVQTHGLNILIDPSPDFREQALNAGIYYLDAVIITHEHYDHVGGLDDLRPLTAGHDIRVYAMPRVAEIIRKTHGYMFERHPYPGVPRIDLHEIDGSVFSIDGLEIIPVEVMHGKLPILGFRIGDFAYVTDAKTISFDEIIKLEGVDTLIINCLRRFPPHFAHFDLDEALKAIAIIKPRHAYLTHICHDFGKYADENPTLPKGVEMAYDGLKLWIN